MLEVRLREYCPADDIKTVSWLNDPEMQATFGLTYSVNVAKHRQWIDQQKNLCLKAIEVDGRHIGNAALHLNPRHESAVLEIYLGEASSRGRGVGFRALELLLKLGFMDLKLHRISLVTRPDNVAAERIYQRAGFQLEGCEKQAIKAHGEFVDQNLWALLRENWLVKQHV